MVLGQILFFVDTFGTRAYLGQVPVECDVIYFHLQFKMNSRMNFTLSFRSVINTPNSVSSPDVISAVENTVYYFK